jgi:hypothetical protein
MDKSVSNPLSSNNVINKSTSIGLSTLYMYSLKVIKPFGVPINLSKNSIVFLVPLDFQSHGVFNIIRLQSSVSASTGVNQLIAHYMTIG